MWLETLCLELDQYCLRMLVLCQKSGDEACRHVFVPNFVGAKVGNVQITPEIQPLIRTAYESRRPEELAVLSRCASSSCSEPNTTLWM